MKKTILNIKMIRPMYTRIVTTADKYSEAECMTNSGLIDTTKVGKMKEIQTVVAVGTSVRTVEVGQKVELNFFAYGKKKFAAGSIKEDMEEHHNQILKYEIPMIELDHKDFLLVDERDITFIITEVEETEVEVNTTGLDLSGILPPGMSKEDLLREFPTSGLDGLILKA